MREENELLRRRFSELARRSDAQATYTFTDFLGLAEQSLLKTMGRELRGGDGPVGGPTSSGWEPAWAERAGLIAVY